MFYGWVIVALAFVAQFVALGAVVHCFPVFLLPIAEEFAIGRAQAALPPAALLVCGIVVGPIVGRLVATHPIRHVMLVGALLQSAGFVALSVTTSFWQFLVIYGVCGSIALTALGTISCNALIVNWFARNRALALGIAMVGMSISGAILIPIASWTVEHFGWRTLCLAFAALSAALTPAILGFVVTRPEELGQRPDGEQPIDPASEPDRDGETASEPSGRAAGSARPEAASGHALEPPPSTRALLANRSLWLIAAACGCVFFGATGLMNHGIAFAVDRGIDPLGAAVLLSAISIGAACGKLVFGALADRLGERGAFAVALVCNGLALVSFATLSSYGGLVGAAALFGLGIGAVAPLQAALLAREFGSRAFAPVMGLVGPLMIPFQIAGPPLAGHLFDTRGSYDLAIWIFLGGTLASGLMLSLLRGSTRPGPTRVLQPA